MATAMGLDATKWRRRFHNGGQCRGGHFLPTTEASASEVEHQQEGTYWDHIYQVAAHVGSGICDSGHGYMAVERASRAIGWLQNANGVRISQRNENGNRNYSDGTG
ncbi:hypothetical protein Pcac1_g25273 [Phytophthora cactorum]|nr:hypothetical protein Pcac1_g25273 [Phytophthora cactorum]KAG3036089.1 hypothetical protein PC121_g24216 [Phytophthora cactorum]KAG3122632.1 hypothetical protein C6341_g26888 [Phytophthora cactorum]